MAVATWLTSIQLPVPVTVRLTLLRLVGLPQSTVPELETATLPMPLLLVPLPTPRFDRSIVPPEAVKPAVCPLVLVIESRPCRLTSPPELACTPVKMSLTGIVVTWEMSNRLFACWPGANHRHKHTR